MTNEDIRQENTYWSRDIVGILGIGDSTLRKWCRIIEAQGYHFIRDDQERRAFTEHDVIMFRSFKELTQEKGLALDSAAKAVVARFDRGASRYVAPTAMTEFRRHDSDMQKLIEHVHHQDEFNKALVSRLDDQQQFIEQSLQRRDEQLMKFIRDSLETKKQLAITEGKRKWWKIWNNNN
jgi:hypothetical protein